MKKTTNNELNLLVVLISIFPLGFWLSGYGSAESSLIFSVIGTWIIVSVNILFSYRGENMDDLAEINVSAGILSATEFLMIIVFFQYKLNLLFWSLSDRDISMMLFNMVVPVVVVAIIYLALFLKMVVKKQAMSRNYSIVLLMALVLQMMSLYTILSFLLIIFVF